MTDRPILVAAPMVRALLDGRKTQTRRVLKDAPHRISGDGGSMFCDRVGPTGWQWTGPGGYPRIPFTPSYAPGDRLYVRESLMLDDDGWLIYSADRAPVALDRIPDGFIVKRAIAPMHMPRWASRLTLTVTDVRVQRVQEISEADAWAEGCAKGDPDDVGGFFPAEEPDPSGIGWRGWDNARDWFADFWDSLNAARGHGWDASPWVVALTFEVHRVNIDALEAA